MGGVSVSARTSRTLPFDAKKNGLYRSRRGFHGVWSCFHNFQKGCVRFGTDFTDIAFCRQKKMGYITLVEEFGLASTIFRRGVSVSARTSRTLPFDANKKKWPISLSSRISRSLVLLPQFSERVWPFWHGLHGHCIL